jgi:hypothetical protein
MPRSFERISPIDPIRRGCHLNDAVATHYGLDRQLHLVEHAQVGLAAALELTRAIYERQPAHYATGEEAVAESLFGFSRGEHDFIELCVNGRDSISVTVELPIRSGWGPFKRGFRDERTVHSLDEAAALVRSYFTLSGEDMGAALRESDNSNR